jgi:hypothetical protein
MPGEGYIFYDMQTYKYHMHADGQMHIESMVSELEGKSVAKYIFNTYPCVKFVQFDYQFNFDRALNQVALVTDLLL